ncbi:Probable long-chain-fatty-acid--CoA ligase FadD [Mycobacteroides abscessus subsp. abscessus]|nr:Probable long-chain-fatty-acid--CoA ligase FadD [Mycobacteroides abscessus subsp. abscessus]
MLEDQLRAHPLISQAMAVGDKQPFIGALITIDPEAIDGWKQRNGKPADATVADLVEDSDLLAEIGTAVKAANQVVSHAEAIKKFRMAEWTSPKVLSHFDIRFVPGVADQLVLKVAAALIGQWRAEGMVQRDDHPTPRAQYAREGCQRHLPIAQIVQGK